VENFGIRPIVTTLRYDPSCEKSVSNLPETLQQHFHFPGFFSGLHSFHIAFTAMEKEDRALACKTHNK
jgi:hypothetical protein